MEEDIPIMARMPERVPRLEGELLLTSRAGESVVPISLVSESAGFGADRDRDAEDMQGLMDEDLSDDIEDRDVDEGGEEADEAREGDASEADEPREDAEKIRFSRQKDLQSYRAASRSRSTADFGNSQEHQERQHQSEPNYGNYGNETGYGQGYERSYGQSYGQSHDQGYEQVPHISPEDEGSEEDPKEGLMDRLLTMRLDRESIQIAPTIILLSLIIALVLTFYTESIPEYPGALASSILIVTLIIYGAATLLKA
jgi:hypothetical protein